MMEGEPVKVYIYDLSKGMARSMSRAFLGKQIDGIWHTGIVVFGQEFYFGGLGGIESCNPGGLEILGPPDNIVEVGKTQIPFEVFMDHLRELGTTTFRGECYNLLRHNCNTFSNEVAMFLTGKPIPSYITSLPDDVMSTPFGSMIRPMIESMQVNPGGHQVFPQGHSQTSSANSASPNSYTNVPATSTKSMENQYFPKTTYLCFDTANIKAIIGKLKELGEKAPSELQERTILLDQLQELGEGKENRIEQLNTLTKILQWPSDILFPALDVLRLSIRNPKVAQHFCNEQQSSTFLNILLSNLTKEQLPANQMLVLRTISNIFQHNQGEKFLMQNAEKIMNGVVKCYPAANKNIEIAASTAMLNYSVVWYKQSDGKAKKRGLEIVDKISVSQSDNEANFRLLVCLGTLTYGDRSCIDYVKEGTTNLVGFVKKCLDIKDPVKLNECAKCITQMSY